ncbi:MAG TPA: hypothetical protein VFG59_13965 [Anaeromyxobacter sp.]|nr:hypothetical protein [Anaeromyxobacter sp.]
MQPVQQLARLEAYLGSLPGGLNAFPECQAKGVLVRMLAAEEAYLGIAALLPPPFRAMVEEPPIGSEWMPEVHFEALMYALADAVGQDDATMLAHVRARDRRMFESPAYRILMVANGPAALLRGAQMRWANWHRGSTLEVEGIADDGVRVALRFPSGLFDGLQLRVFAESFLAALDASQARAPRVEILAADPGMARYRVAWG